MGTLLQRRLFRITAGICMLAVVYLVAWHAGYVQDLAARFGDDGPSPAQIQPDEHDTDPRHKDEAPGEGVSTDHPWWVPPAIIDPDATATNPVPPAGDAPTGTVEVTSTTDHLNQLTVRSEDPEARYSRDAFGPAWSDQAGDFIWTRNGCDTRQDVLKRDLVQEKFEPGTPSCTVLTGCCRPTSTRASRTVDSTRPTGSTRRISTSSTRSHSGTPGPPGDRTVSGDVRR